LFRDLRLGKLPDWIERLSFAPPLLAALHEFMESLVRRDPATGAIDIDTNQFMAIGRAVLQSIPNAETLSKLLDDWQPAIRSETNAKRTALITRFAKDAALRSYTLTTERVDELRAAGLEDAEILDVAATAALWCAAARLEVLTGCLPDFDAEMNSKKEAEPRLKIGAAHTV
jgi:alkylhydroperoxidase family enzyme